MGSNWSEPPKDKNLSKSNAVIMRNKAETYQDVNFNDFDHQTQLFSEFKIISPKISDNLPKTTYIPKDVTEIMQNYTSGGKKQYLTFNKYKKNDTFNGLRKTCINWTDACLGLYGNITYKFKVYYGQKRAEFFVDNVAINFSKHKCHLGDDSTVVIKNTSYITSKDKTNFSTPYIAFLKDCIDDIKIKCSDEEIKLLEQLNSSETKNNIIVLEPCETKIKLIELKTNDSPFYLKLLLDHLDFVVNNNVNFSLINNDDFILVAE